MNTRNNFSSSLVSHQWRCNRSQLDSSSRVESKIKSQTRKIWSGRSGMDEVTLSLYESSHACVHLGQVIRHRGTENE